MSSSFPLAAGRCRSFLQQYGISSDVELVPVQRINEAYERMLKSKIRYRFVIDMASLK